MYLQKCVKSLEGTAPLEGVIWVRMVWELDGVAAAVYRSRFVDADDALALLDDLQGVSSAGGGSADGDITPEPSLKYSRSLEGEAQAEGGCLVEDGMIMVQRPRKIIFVRYRLVVCRVDTRRNQKSEIAVVPFRGYMIPLQSRNLEPVQ